MKSYKNFLEKILNTEEKLNKSTFISFDLSENQPVEKAESFSVRQNRIYGMLDQNLELEEIQVLKENITTRSISCYTPAYQQVSVRNTKWDQKKG